MGITYIFFYTIVPMKNNNDIVNVDLIIPKWG